jgi:hypothetical protein
MEMRLPKLVWLESGAAVDGGVAGWEQPFTADSQSCVVHGRLVAKGCMGAAAQLPVFLWELLCDCTFFWRRTYPTAIQLRTPPSPFFSFLGS